MQRQLWLFSQAALCYRTELSSRVVATLHFTWVEVGLSLSLELKLPHPRFSQQANSCTETASRLTRIQDCMSLTQMCCWWNASTHTVLYIISLTYNNFTRKKLFPLFLPKQRLRQVYWATWSYTHLVKGKLFIPSFIKAILKSFLCGKYTVQHLGMCTTVQGLPQSAG